MSRDDAGEGAWPAEITPFGPAPTRSTAQPAPTPQPETAAKVAVPRLDTEAPAPIEVERLLVLQTASGRLGLPLSAVGGIFDPPTITRVPGSPGWLRGITNLRGEIVAAIDLQSWLTGRLPGELHLCRFLVLGTGNRTVGCLVPRQIVSLTVPKGDLRPAVNHDPHRPIASQVSSELGLLEVLDPAALVETWRQSLARPGSLTGLGQPADTAAAS